jgi:glycosyltransferase involved in cell wall biosynthesis
MKIVRCLFYSFFYIILFQLDLYPITTPSSPRVSIITSVYDGDFFIDRFMKNIVQQTMFSECELILINANSPGNEEEYILPYLEKHSNIKYIKLNYDPGVYGVWNLGIFLAKAPYITNANLDDLRYTDCIQHCANYLDEHPDIALVYTDFVISTDPIHDVKQCQISKIFRHSDVYGHLDESLTKNNIKNCLPGPQPMWRKNAHSKAGLFDDRFLYSGDWEMWCRMAKNGLKFRHFPILSGVYHYNPDGLSTNQVPEKVARRNAENRYIFDTYRQMWHEQDDTKQNEQDNSKKDDEQGDTVNNKPS